MENETLLIYKLERFIRKYYTNRIIRGSLWTAALLSACYLLFIILENVFHFDPPVRMALFFLFVAIAAVAAAVWILVPAAALIRIGRRISNEQAATIIGEHFSEIRDKLLNALQLINQKSGTLGGGALLVAAIDQRIRSLKVFRFEKIIHYRKNLMYLKALFPSLAVILLALIIWPAFVTEPTRRIVNYRTGYEPPVPFQIRILNEKLEAYQQEDLDLIVRLTGEEIPAELYIESEGYSYRMRKVENGNFSYLFKSLQRETSFRIKTQNYISDEFVIRVFPRPTIFSFSVDLTYPPYTGKDHEKLENTGDIIAPEGTAIMWEWNTRDVGVMELRFPDKIVRLEGNGADLFTFGYMCRQTGNYSILPVNLFSKETDTLTYRIICVEDSYPTIRTEEQPDSMSPSRLFFKGSVKDDYGFTRLEFHYSISARTDSAFGPDHSAQLPISRDVKEQRFFHSVEIGEYLMKPGENMRYYFEIWDNDGIHGPKSARSEVREVRTLTLEELKAHAEETEKMIRDDLSNSKRDARDVEKAIEQLSRKLLEKQSLDWQEKRDIEELIRRNEEMLQTIEQIKEKNRSNIRTEEDFLKTSVNILEKQRRLQELMEQMMTDEMKQNLKELREMMNQVDKEKLKNLIEEMKMTANELELQLDRNLELFKQIEFQRKLEENIERLKETAKDQERIAEQTEREKEVTEQHREDQKKMNTRYDSIRQELKKLQEMEKELESPVGIDKTKAKQDSIGESLRDVMEKMNQKDGKGASKSQKNTSKQMKELAEQMEQMQMEAELDQYAEDAHQIRQILEHLVTVSFKQEELLGRTMSVNRNDPGFQLIITDQKQLSENLEPVKDSLAAIGKRQFMIQPVISRELNSLNRNIEETVQNLTDRNMAKALTGQQFSMTSLNNLAILLDEAMEQMNQNMKLSLMGKNSKMCQNPSMGRGKKSMKNIRQMQQQLSEQMEKLMKGMQEKMDKQGMKSTEGKGGTNERIARMAAEQEAIREELQRYSQYMKEQGATDPNGLNEAIQGMEQNERDLINKQVTRESLLRQQKILTRLLESERAEQIREQQEQRESNEAKNQKRSNPEQNLEYNRYLSGGADILRYRTLPVSRYYKSKANTYLIQISK